MIFLTVFQTALPVFLVMAAGYLFGFFKKIDLESTSDLVMYLTSPCLAFTVIYKGAFNSGDFLALWGGFLWVTFFLWGFIFLLLRTPEGKNLSWYYLPVIFMNSGNLGFPLALVFFGEKGLTMAVLINTINAILIYSWGVTLAKGSGNFWEFLKLPYIYAVAAAVIFMLARIRIPLIIFNPLVMIGNLTIPLMLLSLGHRLHDFKMKYFLGALFPTFLRIFGGFFMALIFVYLFKIEGLARDVILLVASLPAAITSYVLAEKYDFYPEQVATAVTVSNCLGVIFVPLVVWLINYL